MIKLTGKYLVTEVKKKTHAKMFKNIKDGNVIHFSLELKYLGHNHRRGTYATYIKIENMNTGEVTHKSMNQLASILECFEFVEF